MNVERQGSYEQAGLPRPRAFWESHGSREGRYASMRLPVPWINGIEDCDFHTFRADGFRAHTERLCQVCGNPLNKRILLGAYSGNKMTSGPGGHPHCIRLAVNLCPHLRDVVGDTIAWEYIGGGNGYCVHPDGYDTFWEWADAMGWGGGEEIHRSARPLTRDDVAEIAKTDPWGHKETYLHA